MTTPPPRFACPCCGLPTLPSLMAAVCSVCWFEADGMDLPEDEIRGSPNSGYSLRRARQNFRAHGDMYDPGDRRTLHRDPTDARRRLLAYAQAVLRGEAALDRGRLDRLIAEDRDAWPWRNQPVEESGPDEEALLRALMNAAAPRKGS